METTHEILIIDDDANFRRILELRVRALFESPVFRTCDSLSSARASLRSTPFEGDLIFLDQNLTDGLGVSFLEEGWFADRAVLMVSSDPSPSVPGASVRAGAAYFLAKRDVTLPLFGPLVRGVVERNRAVAAANAARDAVVRIETIKTLVSTLKHEINNPLGAVLGAAFLLKSRRDASPDELEAANLVEESGRRIKHVIDELSSITSVESVKKAHAEVFHVPGDAPWKR